MNRNKARKIGIMLLLVLQLSLLFTVNTLATVMNGTIDEITWNHWFTDGGSPKFTVYTSEDEINVYLGVITESTIPDSAQLEVCFKGAEYDWAIMISDTSGLQYKRSKLDPGIGGDYWKKAQSGLPEGVEAVRGVTGSTYSYEISISKEILGEYAIDYPDKFKLWIMYTIDGDGSWIWTSLDLEGEVNFYPDIRGGWWFSNVALEKDEAPMFHAPEVPIGTLMSLATMLAVIYLRGKETKLPLSK